MVDGNVGIICGNEQTQEARKLARLLSFFFFFNSSLMRTIKKSFKSYLNPFSGQCLQKPKDLPLGITSEMFHRPLITTSQGTRLQTLT
jgi:hypothetical protein